MKRLTLFFMSLLVCLMASAQSGLPQFSTEADPLWYSVKFKGGGNYLADQGADAQMLTAATVGQEGQFQFIGTAESCIMKSRTGHYLVYKKANASDANAFFMTTTDASAATQLAIIQGTEDNYYEIKVVSTGGCMNQWQGTGSGKKLGAYNAGDTNNQLFFELRSVVYPTFSNETTERWYFIRFAAGVRQMAATTAGELVTLCTADPVNGQLWKLVGDKDNFQLVNKDGLYAIVSSEGVQTTTGGYNGTPIRASQTEQPQGYSLSENTQRDGTFNVDINANSGKALNQWGSAAEGQTIGVWDTNNVNDAVVFIPEDEMTYADYKTSGIEDFIPEHPLTMWYTQPATTAPLYAGGQGYSNWMEWSLPIGNGQLGASIFGGVAVDEVQLNEKTLWSGKSTDQTGNYGKYENFGSLYAEDISGEFNYSSQGGATGYLRLLDLANAVAKVQYGNTDGSTQYYREYIASNPSNVIVAHYTASQSGKLSRRFTLKSGNVLKAATTYADAQGTFSGKLTTVSYNARFKVVNIGGTLTTTNEGVEVRNADEILVFLTGGTDFDPYADTYISNTAGLANRIQSTINDAAAQTWSALLDAHKADFKQYFDRVDLQLAGTKNNVPTNELVDTYNKGQGDNALMLEQLYFAYGRYLEICSSRGVDLPSNLQGIWSNMDQPAWNADIHSNINVQMNYWPAEPTNLSEMHVPFCNYIINMANSASWKQWAKDQGQSRGWTCYTENNIFGGCGGFMHNYVISNAWYCTHLWQHYRYTLDKEFLKRAFPAMLSASQFWMDRLKLDTDGSYVCPNEYSPEHGPSEDGVAHAQQLVYELFSNTLEAKAILGDDAVITAIDLEKLEDRFAKLDKGLATETYTGEWGDVCNGLSKGSTILREWKKSNYTRGANGHRHMSHLMCMYPYAQVVPGTELFDAAVNSMTLRGDGATGWSMGWKINLWARAQQGDHARTILNNALAHSNGGAGVFYNLYDSHAPFQIDGNFGACAGMAEMLMQSVSDTIRILPALPSAWAAGSVRGLKAVKDFTVSIDWKDGMPTSVVIRNNQGQTMPVSHPNMRYATVKKDGVVVRVERPASNVVILPAEAGAEYTFEFGDEDVTAIESINQEARLMGVDVAGCSVRVQGDDVQRVRVYDLAGRTIHTTTQQAFTLSQAAQSTVLVEVARQNGRVTTCKVALGK